MPSPWDSRLAATFGVRRAQIDKAAAWAADAVDAVVRKNWARLNRLARGGGPFNHVYTLAREIIGQMQAETMAVVTSRLYGAADWSYSTAVDALLNALPTEAYRWLVAERLFGTPQVQEQVAWPPKLTKAQRRNMDFEARALGYTDVDAYLDHLLRLLPAGMDDADRYAAIATLVRDTHGKLPPDRVTAFVPQNKQATIVLGRPDSLSKWWAAGFHKLPRAQQQDVLRQFVFEPPTKEQIKRIVEKPSSFGGKPPMGYHDRLEMLSHVIADKDQLARRFAASVSNGDLPRDTMLAILPQVNGYKVSAQRIARTELARVANGMAEETFADCQDVIDGYQIHEVMDVVTRPHHAARNGKIWFVNGNPPAEERPTLPDEWNCRGWYSPVLKTPDAVKNNPELLKQYRANAGPIQDPLVYSQWWDRASDEERRAVVGSRRYDAVAQKIAGAGKPKFEDFVDPQTGELIRTDQLRGEDLAAFAARRQANAEAFQQRAALLRQTAEKSFLDVPTGGGNPPPPIKPVKPPPAPKPPAKPKAKPIKPAKPKPAPKPKPEVTPPALPKPEPPKNSPAPANTKGPAMPAIDTTDAELAAVRAAKYSDKLAAFTSPDAFIAAAKNYTPRDWAKETEDAVQANREKKTALLARMNEVGLQINNMKLSAKERKAAKEEWRKLRDEEEAITKRSGEIREEFRKLRQQESDRLAELIALPAGKGKGFGINNASAFNGPSAFTGADRENLDRIRKWYKSVLGDYNGTNSATFIDANKIPSGSRSFATRGTINMAEGAEERVYAHELGHILNDHTPVNTAAVVFRSRRIGLRPGGDYDKLRPMNDFATHGKYDVGELTFGVDDWEKLSLAFGYSKEDARQRAAYIGKDYFHGNTEVISMGMEFMHADPVLFAKTDPEYFKLILGTLRGAFQ